MTNIFEGFPKEESPESTREKVVYQLEHPDKIDLREGDKIDVVDVRPEKPKTETPAFWLGGWGTTVEVYKDNIINLVEHGRRTLAIDALSGVESAHIQESSIEQGQKIPEIELRKVAALLETIDKKGIDKTDIVAHSEGAIYGVMAALLRPEKFRNIVLVDPAGMIGEDTTGRLVKGAILDLALQVSRDYSKILSKDGFKAFTQSNMAAKALVQVFSSNPKETIKSVGAIAESQIGEILKTLKQLGMGISIIHAVDDTFFPMENIQATTNREMVTGFYSVKGTHNQLYLHPEQYTNLVDNALDALEKISKDEKSKEGLTSK